MYGVEFTTSIAFLRDFIYTGSCRSLGVLAILLVYEVVEYSVRSMEYRV